MNKILIEDAKILIAIANNHFSCDLFSLLASLGLTNENLLPTIDELNFSLSKLVFAKLITIDNKIIKLTFKSKMITKGSYYLDFETWKQKTIEEVCEKEYDEVDLTCGNYFTKSEYEQAKTMHYERIGKYFINNTKEKTLKKSIAKTAFYFFGCLFLLLFLLFLCVMCMTNGIIDAGFAMIIFTLYFPITCCLGVKYLNLKRCKELHYFQILENKKFIAVNIIMVVLIVLFFSIMSFFAQIYIVGIIVIICIASLLLFEVKWLASTKFAKRKIFKTKKLVAKVYSNSYFMNGVDVFEDKNRQRIDNIKVEISNPHSKKMVCNCDHVYRIDGKNFSFYITVIKYDKCSIIFLLRFRDFHKIFYYQTNSMLWEDSNENTIVERKALAEAVRMDLNESTANDFLYSKDWLIRGSNYQKDNKFATKIELAQFGKRFDRYNENKDYLEYSVNEEVSYYWQFYFEELFDTIEQAEMYLTEIMREIECNQIITDIWYE